MSGEPPPDLSAVCESRRFSLISLEPVAGFKCDYHGLMSVMVGAAPCGMLVWWRETVGPSHWEVEKRLWFSSCKQQVRSAASSGFCAAVQVLRLRLYFAAPHTIRSQGFTSPH